MSKEALKLARSVISSINRGKQHALTHNEETVFWQREEWVRWALDEVLPLIDEALAQPEQEPVAWGVDWGKDGQQSCVSIVKRKPNDGIEVVAIEYNPTPSPPQRKPLTDEQIAHATASVFMGGNPSLTGIARAIEAAHGIKEQNNG